MNNAPLSDGPRNKSCPTALVRRTKTATVVAVEELVEQDIVPEVRVSVQLWVTAVARPAAFHVSAEDVDQTVLDLIGRAGKRHVVATASRALYCKCIAVVLMETLKTTVSVALLQHSPFNQQEIDSNPDRATPVGVSTKLPLATQA